MVGGLASRAIQPPLSSISLGDKGAFANPSKALAMSSIDPRTSEYENPIPALMPRGGGHQFLVYGDSCSGVPGAPHEATFAAVNAAIRRLSPPPEFITFLGDEVIGLTQDEEELKAQWCYWLEVETAWIDRQTTSVFHTSSNHTTYDKNSEGIFTHVLSHLPRNGPPGQEGLAYSVRWGDLLMVFVHTSAMALGGEGHLETEWLAETLSDHWDARFKLVFGHHPAFPVNGFSGPYQREIGPEYTQAFWDLLVEHGVSAYLCSHILAFDVQVHRGVLQITTAGAGTAHRMPERVEYLHFVQMVVDGTGSRYQVVDPKGVVRERLDWPGVLAGSLDWAEMSDELDGGPSTLDGDAVTVFRFSGRASPPSVGPAETLVEAWSPNPVRVPIWIGLTGPRRRLTVILAPETGRSPHSWFGPPCADDTDFDLEVALHPGMGPGGVLWRSHGTVAWNTLDGASPWGAERLKGTSKNPRLRSPVL
jgi:hypothetical protein